MTSLDLAATTLADPMEALVHFSRLLGSDPSLVLRGGGNTSVKRMERDVAGRAIHVLRVKGSGSDLAAAKAADFPGVRMDDVLPLFAREAMSDEDMVAYLSRCLTDPAAPRPSIETLLHAFIPAASVFHSHADAILQVVNTARPAEALGEAFGDDVLAVRYLRPGFQLSREVGEAVRARPDAAGLVLLNHGLVTWGATPEEAYRAHLALVERAAAAVERRRSRVFAPARDRFPAREARETAAAALAPVLRGALSLERRLFLRYCGEQDVLDFVGSPRAREVTVAGAATPDHILTTGRLPLWLDIEDAAAADVPARVRAALDEYRSAYEAYVARWRTDEPALPPIPRIVLVPGLGMFTAAKDPATAAVARDIYRHTIGIMAGAEGFGGYRSLSEQDGFHAEYWPLELYKLTLAPPEREMERRVALVTGAGGGIGRAVALQLARAGARVVATDLDAAAAAHTARLLEAIPGHGAALAPALDVTRERDLDDALRETALLYGGVDVVVSNAGIAHVSPLESLTLEEWERSMAVNATGHFLVTRAALRHFRRQGLGGNLVFVATKNVTAPGKDFGAYSAAKAAEAQLARVAAIEGGEIGVRVNMVNPDAVFSATGLWSAEMREQRARAHGIDPSGIDAFYRKRTLLNVEVRAEDVAEAVLFLASDRSSRTTGCMIPVDGGVREAFPR